MPELPDVEIFRRTIDKEARGKIIKNFTLHKNDIIESSRNKLNGMKGHKISSTLRIGKYCFIEVEEFDWLALHFGMTGYAVAYDEKEPEYSAFSFHFDNNENLSLISKRKLGKIEACREPGEYTRENHIGKDAMELSKEEFLDLLGNKKGGIKSALMDQSLIAGLGNIYSDEILFQSKIHPKETISDINESDRKKLFKKMKEVLKKAIDAGADPEKLPKNFLIPVRSEGEDCPACKGKVKKIKISGRGSYYCPSCQSK